MIKTEYIVFIITAILVANTYYDGQLIKLFQSNSAMGIKKATPMAPPSLGGAPPGGVSAAERRVLNSGKGSSKRSVSETKKKYVAAQQGWKCGDCQRQLPAWFEVDHVIALEHGGSNHVDNLVALCRDCHGKKTAMSFL